MRIVSTASLALAICLVDSPAVLAQQGAPVRGFVSANVAIQEGPQTLALDVPVELFESQGVLTVDDGLICCSVIDVSGGLRGRRFAFGVGYTRGSTTGAHDLTASTVPVTSGSFRRSVNGVTPPLEHTERIVYVFAGATRQVTDRFDLMFSAGPAFFSLKQEVPTGLTVTEFPQIIQDVSTDIVNDTAIGFHLSLDLNYMFHPKLGIGGLVRYAWGSVELPNATQSMTLGGISFGAGVRARF
jgi:hypothetical protein